MIDFSIQEIQASLSICHNLLAKLEKWQRDLRDSHEQLMNQLVKAINQAETKRKMAEEEYSLACRVIERNKSTASQLESQKTSVENQIDVQNQRICLCDGQIAQGNSRLNTLTAPILRDNSEESHAAYAREKAAYDSEVQSIRSSIAANEREKTEAKREVGELENQCNLLKNKLGKIKQANEQLEHTKNVISSSIGQLKSFMERCISIKDSLENAYEKLNYYIKSFRLYLIQRVLPQMEVALRCGLSVQNELKSFYYTSDNANSGVYSHTAIRFESLEFLQQVCEKWDMMNRELSRNAPMLLDCTNNYRRAMHSRVSVQVGNCVQEINQSLEHLYGILQIQSQKLSRTATYLQDYLNSIMNI